MNKLLTIIFILTTSSAISQNCDLIVVDKFTKDKEARFFLDGIKGYKPYLMLHVKVDGRYANSSFRIECHAGTGDIDNMGIRDYTSRTLKYISREENNIFLYFLFEDGKSIYLYSPKSVVYSNSVYFNVKENTELLTYFKTKKVTDIRLVFNDMKADYTLPTNTTYNQEYFKRLVNCLNF